MSLTPGCMSSYAVDRQAISDGVVQILEIKMVDATGPNGKTQRCKLLISDGVTAAQATTFSGLNERAASGEFPAFSVVRIKSSGVNTLPNDKWILIITEMEPLRRESGPIGNPQVVTPGQAGSAAWTAPAGVLPVGGGSAALPRPAPYGGGAGASSSSSSAAAGPVVRNPASAVAGGGQAYVPVSSLNPYNSRWTIKVRVTSKGDVKNWSNARGTGKLFSCDLLDEHGGEIRATFFQAAVDRFYDMLAKDSIYYMGGGKLKVANKQYTSIRHEYEIQFDEKTTTITPAGDDARIAKVLFHFVKLDKLESMQPNTAVDVLGVVVSPGSQADIVSKAGKALSKRDVGIADDTGTQVTLTLWGDRSHTDVKEGDLLAIKGAKLGDFGGRSLSAWATTIVDINPDESAVPDGARLRAWWAQTGGAGVTSISNQRGGGGAGGGDGPLTKVELRYPVSALRDEHLAQRDPVQGALAVVKASIMTIRADPDKLWYPACSQNRDGRTCNKKLTDNGGMWSCNSCGEVPQGPSYRYIMSAQLADASGANYVTLFDAEATAVVGKDANTLHKIVSDAAAAGATNAELESILREATFKEYLFSVKVKMETVRDEQRVKGTVMKVRPLDYARETRVLLEGIKKYQPVMR